MSDSLFPEFDTPAPAVAETAPLFDITQSPAARPVDYGQAVEPVRESRTDALLDVELTMPDEDAAVLAFGIGIADTDR